MCLSSHALLRQQSLGQQRLGQQDSIENAAGMSQEGNTVMTPEEAMENFSCGAKPIDWNIHDYGTDAPVQTKQTMSEIMRETHPVRRLVTLTQPVIQQPVLASRTMH